VDEIVYPVIAVPAVAVSPEDESVKAGAASWTSPTNGENEEVIPQTWDEV
jgi:hypothetical protein